MDEDEPLRGSTAYASSPAPTTKCNVIADDLTDADFPVEVLEANSPDETSRGVRLATMHRVKGLEFDRMVIVSVNETIGLFHWPQPCPTMTVPSALPPRLPNGRCCT